MALRGEALCAGCGQITTACGFFDESYCDESYCDECMWREQQENDYETEERRQDDERRWNKENITR